MPRAVPLVAVIGGVVMFGAVFARIPALPELASEIESALALSLREAVTNIVRHAGADRVEAELQADPRSLVLSISDDGRGTPIQPGNGLTGMRERTEHRWARAARDAWRRRGCGRATWASRSSGVPVPSCSCVWVNVKIHRLFGKICMKLSIYLIFTMGMRDSESQVFTRVR